jgi:hypothetical protein
MLLKIKKDQVYVPPSRVTQHSDLNFSLESLKQPPSIVNQKELYQRRHSQEIIESYNSVQAKNG